MKLHTTRIDLTESLRREAVAMLNECLADILDLHLQAKQAHWNVKGPHFIALHELFDKVAEELEEFADEIAERAVALGGIASGTAQLIAKHTRLPPIAPDLVTGRGHLAALSDNVAAFARSVRIAIDTAGRLPDADTADLFTGVSRGMDKLLWLLEAHLQATE